MCVNGSVRKQYSRQNATRFVEDVVATANPKHHASWTGGLAHIRAHKPRFSLLENSGGITRLCQKCTELIL